MCLSDSWMSTGQLLELSKNGTSPFPGSSRNFSVAIPAI